MLRRDFVIGQSALVASACDVEPPAGREVHTSDATPPTVPTALAPSVPPPPRATPHAGAGPDEAAMKAAGACITAGEACLQHCLGLLGVGDVGLAACARSVVDMIAVSQATQALAAAGAPELRAQAAVAVAVISRCEELCSHHGVHHDACHTCAACCSAALKELRRLAT